jgi:hypothetical protein
MFDKDNLRILTAKLTPLATNTTLETVFVPPAQGSTHWPDALPHVEPGPLVGSNPAEKASDWKSVVVYTIGPTLYRLISV